MTGEKASSVGRVRRVDEHIVPTGRRGGIAFVVALGVARRGADDAGEAEARSYHAFDKRQGPGVGGDPH